MRRSMTGTMVALALLGAVTFGQQSFRRTIGVSGKTDASTSFALTLDASPLLRVINFTNLATDYSALAMAELMVLRINENYAENGNTGFTAALPRKADGTTRYDATFVLYSPNPILAISVGSIGGSGAPAPRAPGIGFNPFLIDHEAGSPTPYVPPNPGAAPNAQLRLNGLNPADDFFRTIEVPIEPFQGLGGQLVFEFFSGTNPQMGVIFFAGPFNPGIYVTPWGDTLDVGAPTPGPSPIPGGIVFLADGISQSVGPFDPFFVTNAQTPARLAQPLTIPVAFAGTPSPGYQAAIADPTIGFPGFALTQSAHPRYELGRTQNLTIGTDGFAPVPFVDPLSTFEFYGQSYGGLFVHENGAITFNAPPAASGVPSLADPMVTTGGPPAVFVNWGDWDLGSTGGQLAYREFGDEVRFAWGTPQSPISHFNDGDSAWFECTLKLSRGTPGPTDSPGAILVDYGNLDANAVTGNDAVIGITPGLGLDATPVSRDLGRPVLAPGAMRMLVDQENESGNLTALATFQVPAGGAQLYHNGRRWSARHLGFYAPLGTGPAPDRYLALSEKPHPPDFRGVAPGTTTISASAIQQFILVGYFRFLNPNPSGGPGLVARITDPAGAAPPVPLTILGVLSASTPGPFLPPLPLQLGFRDFEGLVVESTGLPAGYAVGQAVDVRVAFIDAQGTVTPFVAPAALTVSP